MHLHRLAPFTSLFVCTVNSLYRVITSDGPKVYIQGGFFFPDATSPYLVGATIEGSCLRIGWIAVGLLMEIRSGDRRVITSRVRRITAERVSSPAVHYSALHI